MFAIIEVGGKQYKVAENDEIYVEKLTNKVGEKVKLDKVLMIDDNESLVEMVSEYFSNHNKIEVVLSSKDGEEGLNTIINKGDEYDVILLDLVMPKKDGLYVLDELNKRGIEKNIIVETSYNEPKVIRKVSEYGVSYYVLKPFDLTDLENKILEMFSSLSSKSINLYIPSSYLYLKSSSIL